MAQHYGETPKKNANRSTGGYSRRTVVKGAAWAVPVVAAAAAAPSYAATYPDPPTPDIDFGPACGNTGATQKGCGGNKTLQVPLTLSNHTGRDVVFQITAMYTCNCATAPTAPGTGVVAGVRGIHETPSHAYTDHSNCSPSTPSDCLGGVTNGGVLVPNGTTDKKFWIESNSLGDSSSFSSTIRWRMLDAETCETLTSGQSQTASAIEPQNCGSAPK